MTPRGSFDDLRARRKKTGQPPGALHYSGKQTETPVTVTRLVYGPDAARQDQPATMLECAAPAGENRVRWIDLCGLSRVEFIEQAGEAFSLHPLTLEDIAHPWQRPKLEDMDSYLFCVLKLLKHDQTGGAIEEEQVSLILGPDSVVSFQETDSGVFTPVRERILAGKGRIRKMGADYLFHALLDAVVDSYFPVLEQMGDAIEAIEEKLLAMPGASPLKELHALRREALFLRKRIWPLREVVGRLEKDVSSLVTDQTRRYVRDLYDHVIQIMDTVETFRDMLSGLVDLHISTINLRMNQVMKVLTIISTIFIPLTFLAGVYGMNFKYMPEYDMPYAYPALWCVMVSVALGMVALFRRLKWF